MGNNPIEHDDDGSVPRPGSLTAVARRMLLDREVFRRTLPDHYVSDPLLEELLGLYASETRPDDQAHGWSWTSLRAKANRDRRLAVLVSDGLVIRKAGTVGLSQTGRAMVEQALCELVA